MVAAAVRPYNRLKRRRPYRCRRHRELEDGPLGCRCASQGADTDPPDDVDRGRRSRPRHPAGRHTCRRQRAAPDRAGRDVLHARQRAGGGSDSRPSGARRDPHGLVQGRRRRRVRGQVWYRPFPRTPHVQGHQDPSRGRVLARGVGDRRRRERVHDRRLHGLFPARREGTPAARDVLRGGPDAEPGPDRRERDARAPGGARGAQHARRE